MHRPPGAAPSPRVIQGTAAARGWRPARSIVVPPRQARVVRLRITQQPGNPHMARIAFQGIAKRFGDVSVIEQLDLEIHDHEFMVFVGPSGCGKSTALRMIAGLEEPSEGTLVIGDRVVNDVHPKDRDVAMVFQSYALYPHMTVRENIAFGLQHPQDARGRDRQARRRGRGHPRAEAAARPQAEGALGRPAPARRARPRDRAQAVGVPVRRAALEPRCRAARADARRDLEAAAPPARPPPCTSRTTRSKR